MALLPLDTRRKYLRTFGFRGGDTTMVRNFQAGWNLGTWLAVDGIYGPATDTALKRSWANHVAQRGDASAHFSFVEFRCKCAGRFPRCQGVWVHRAHLRRMESMRSVTGQLTIVSGCRCGPYNKEVGGAATSQHVFGVACDVPGELTLARVKALGVFAGIGFSTSSGLVLHVDSRDLGGHNTTNGHPKSPTVWRYA